jgi:hypothetical protein
VLIASMTPSTSHVLVLLAMDAHAVADVLCR